MKKTIMYLKSVAVCGIMAAAFIGCGGNSDSSGSSKSEPIPAPEEENKVDTLAVIAELNAEYERTQEEWQRGYVGEIHQRNVMTIIINRRGEILTEIDLHAHLCSIESVKNRTILFLTPYREPQMADTLPSLPCLRNDGTHPETTENYFDSIGRVSISKGIVFLLKDNDETSQATYNEVKKQLVDAILEMRNIQSERYFGRSYFQLTVEERNVVGKMIPMSIIETTHDELYETPPPPVPEPEWNYEEIEAVSEEEIISSEADYFE